MEILIHNYEDTYVKDNTKMKPMTELSSKGRFTYTSQETGNTDKIMIMVTQLHL